MVKLMSKAECEKLFESMPESREAIISFLVAQFRTEAVRAVAATRTTAELRDLMYGIHRACAGAL